VDSFSSLTKKKLGGREFGFYSLPTAEKNGLSGISKLPHCRKILLENMLRKEDGSIVTKAAIESYVAGKPTTVPFYPARVYLHDLLGLPLMVELASIRDAMVEAKADPALVNPTIPVDLIIDHSLMVVHSANATAQKMNEEVEFSRNRERFALVRWCQKAFKNFRAIPPGKGIMHQINVEHLAQVVWINEDDNMVYPDTVLGTDSHTPMVNGVSVAGWGVGGIEAEAAMMGRNVSFPGPDVVGINLSGKITPGVTATDIVLTITEMLRKYGVVDKFVEFYGAGVSNLSVPDRATISNMAPEYGATCVYFPVDDQTLSYLKLTGRPDDQIALVEDYAKEQGLWRDDAITPEFTDTINLDLSTVVPCLAGPRRPEDRVDLDKATALFNDSLTDYYKVDKSADRKIKVPGEDFEIDDGSVIVAAITSCTNTSNPALVVAAGLLAKKAVEKGLSRKPWVKPSLAPGSQVVGDYLIKAGLQPYLDELGYQIVGYGCTTCNGMSGPLSDNMTAALKDKDLVGVAVLSGNRNFEGRIHPFARANFIASPPLVVAYAIAGSLKVDITKDALGNDKDGNPVYLKDIWPTPQEVQDAVEASITPEMFQKRRAELFDGGKVWDELSPGDSLTYTWQEDSTYIRKPPFFDGIAPTPPGTSDIKGMYPIAILGDSITTDHITPSGNIKLESVGGEYLTKHGVVENDFNSYGTRRGNFEMVSRATFANIRLRNEMVPGVEGSFTKKMPEGKQMTIFDAATEYLKEGKKLVIVAGKEYGQGSSRDTAAKGPKLLGVKAIVAESFERIHRSNLIGMGVLPVQFINGVDRNTLKLDGSETFDLTGLGGKLLPGMEITLTVHRADGTSESAPVKLRLDTEDEVNTVMHDGILPMILRDFTGRAAAA
jgi:aconitate hydratase